MLQQMDQPLHQCEQQLEYLSRKSLCDAAASQEREDILENLQIDLEQTL